ncbi:leucyl/phenylalanyl-tRNA--protein transferase [Planctomycetota bacterium]|nr:leucyl/phenylalanyl-tRNA--protein transferase [Planctomycetota bacterium]
MARAPRRPVLLLPGSAPSFPNPVGFDAEGLIAFGGDLSPERLLAGYANGVFPWYSEDQVPLWWSPDPRALLSPARLHISRSMQKVLRRGEFSLTWNSCFARVMSECGKEREGGTWVTQEMLVAYLQLHRLGHAHSLEVWVDGELAGGVYGVQLGALFAAESMFHRRTNMSKVALVALLRSLFANGIELLDVQFVTAHLASLGAFEVPRTEYLRRVRLASKQSVSLLALVPDLSSVAP